MTHQPVKKKVVRSAEAKAMQRGKRIFDKLFWGGILEFDSVAKTPRTKLGYVLQHNLAERTQRGIKFSPLARRLWESTHHTNVAWAKLTPSMQARWIQENAEWFAKNKSALLSNQPPHVKTASQYFYRYSAELLKRAKSLSKMMQKITNHEEYETAYNEYLRMRKRASIYRGIAERLGKKELDETPHTKSPHSL